MEEVNLRKCKVCGEVKKHIHKGKFDHKTKKFVDETGAYWNGRSCGACHREQVKASMSKLRFSRRPKKEEEKDEKTVE